METETQGRKEGPAAEALETRFSGAASGYPFPGKWRGETYYGLPPVKPSDYGVKVATSFFFEGIGGSSQILSTLADLFGGEDGRSIARAGRYLAFASGMGASALFVIDLKTRSRFGNMFRIFRKTSLMSVGSWSLGAFTALSGLAAMGQALVDLGAAKPEFLLGRLISGAAAKTGTMVSAYTGAELETTSTPLWAESSPLMSMLFASSGMANAAAALTLLSGKNGSRDLNRRLSLLGIVARAFELPLAVAVDRRWKQKTSYRGSREARRYRFGVLAMGISLPLLLDLIGGGKRYLKISSAAGLCGGFLLPLTVLQAGNRSADEPSDYFEYTQTPARRPPMPAGAGINGRPEVPKKKERKITRRLIGAGMMAALAGAALYLMTRVSLSERT